MRELRGGEIRDWHPIMCSMRCLGAAMLLLVGLVDVVYGGVCIR